MSKKFQPQCFDGFSSQQHLDREPFKARHKLGDHPALSIANLQKVLPNLPSDQVFFSSGALQKTDNFDRAHLDKKNRFSLEEALSNLLQSNAYIMVRSPEVDPSFRDIFNSLRSDVEQVMKAQGLGTHAIEPMLYLFIASPKSITPFHIDRYSTLLLQLQGTKKVFLYPAWDERFCSAETLEGFVSRAGVRPVYSEEMGSHAQCFDFGPGEVLHIPFVAPHHVENGAHSVSISLSIIFNTRESNIKTKALMMNHLLRKYGQNISWQPSPVNSSALGDVVKGNAWRILSRINVRKSA